MFNKVLFCFIFFVFSINAETIETFYGPLEVEESVLLELIKCPAMQRLKDIHQYGVAYYTKTHAEEYNRFDHSVGVFALLRKKGAGLEEQISGLLHDVSHTVFSHVGDWIFGKEYQENDYQGSIQKIYLSISGIEDILIKHGYTLQQVAPKRKDFQMLEQLLPDLCADRLDYNLQGAYYQKFLTKEEVIELYEDFQFIDGHWMTKKVHLLKKLALFSIFMTEDCWGSAGNYAASRWLADAILKGLDIGLLSWKEIHCGIDQEVWNKLLHSDNAVIQEKMRKVRCHEDYYRYVDCTKAHVIVKFKCRAIDPWVLHQGTRKRLSAIDSDFAGKLNALKKKADEGWSIQMY